MEPAWAGPAFSNKPTVTEFFLGTGGGAFDSATYRHPSSSSLSTCEDDHSTVVASYGALDGDRGIETGLISSRSSGAGGEGKDEDSFSSRTDMSTAASSACALTENFSSAATRFASVSTVAEETIACAPAKQPHHDPVAASASAAPVSCGSSASAISSSYSSSAAAAAAAAPSSSLTSAPPARPARRTKCRDVSEFQVLDTIGEGTYGVVSRARDPSTGSLVALKKVKLTAETEGFSMLAIRELEGLQALRPHPNMVHLHEVVTSQPSEFNRNLGDVFFVFEYAEHDLAGLLRASRNPNSGFVMNEARVRSYMHQLLTGLAHMHAHSWVHRDLKTANLLITAGNVLKIADLGMARSMLWPGKFTPRVVTLWYRAPELIYQDRGAGVSVDMWSAGCVMGELLSGREIMTGESELEQIHAIYKLCGVPDPSTWEGLASLPAFVTMRPKQKFAPQFKQRFAHVPPVALDLLEKMLCMNPHNRITAVEALRHPFFEEGGGVADPSTLPSITLASAHDMEVRDADRAERKVERAAAKHAAAAAAPAATAAAAGGGGGRAAQHHPHHHHAGHAPSSGAPRAPGAPVQQQHGHAQHGGSAMPPHQPSATLGAGHPHPRKRKLSDLGSSIPPPLPPEPSTAAAPPPPVPLFTSIPGLQPAAAAAAALPPQFIDPSSHLSTRLPLAGGASTDSALFSSQRLVNQAAVAAVFPSSVATSSLDDVTQFRANALLPQGTSTPSEPPSVPCVNSSVPSASHQPLSGDSSRPAASAIDIIVAASSLSASPFAVSCTAAATAQGVDAPSLRTAAPAAAPATASRPAAASALLSVLARATMKGARGAGGGLLPRPLSIGPHSAVAAAAVSTSLVASGIAAPLAAAEPEQPVVVAALSVQPGTDDDMFLGSRR